MLPANATAEAVSSKQCSFPTILAERIGRPRPTACSRLQISAPFIYKVIYASCHATRGSHLKNKRHSSVSFTGPTQVPSQNSFPRMGRLHPSVYIGVGMARVSRHPWTAEEIDLLYSLIKGGASPARASVVLKRPMLAVRSKARALGRPFPDSRQVRATRLSREASELKAIEQSST